MIAWQLVFGYYSSASETGWQRLRQTSRERGKNATRHLCLRCGPFDKCPPCAFFYSRLVLLSSSLTTNHHHHPRVSLFIERTLNLISLVVGTRCCFRPHMVVSLCPARFLSLLGPGQLGLTIPLTRRTPPVCSTTGQHGHSENGSYSLSSMAVNLHKREARV